MNTASKTLNPKAAGEQAFITSFAFIPQPKMEVITVTFNTFSQTASYIGGLASTIYIFIRLATFLILKAKFQKTLEYYFKKEYI